MLAWSQSFVKKSSGKTGRGLATSRICPRCLCAYITRNYLEFGHSKTVKMLSEHKLNLWRKFWGRLDGDVTPKIGNFLRFWNKCIFTFGGWHFFGIVVVAVRHAFEAVVYIENYQILHEASHRIWCHKLLLVGSYPEKQFKSAFIEMRINDRKCRLRRFGTNFSGMSFCMPHQLVGLLF